MNKFNTLTAAVRFTENGNYSGQQILLGCDGLFWVCSNKKALQLMKQGYELA